MKAIRFQPASSEIPLTLSSDGLRLRIPLPESLARRLENRYSAGIHMMYEMISREIPGLQEISLNGIVLCSGNTEPEFHVFTVSVRTSEERYFLSMEEAASLLRDNGIPHAKLTALQALP